jgi:predicted anti-sigma-YlaC factor YlaD
MTTACDRAREAISLALDGELQGLEQTRLAAHLRRCQTCRAYQAETGALTGVLREAELEAAPFEIVMPRRRYGRPRFAAVAASVAAVAVVAAASLERVMTQTSHTTGASYNLIVDSRHDPSPVRDVHAAASAKRHYVPF